MRDLKMMPLGDQVAEYVGMIHVSLNHCDIGVRKENDDLSAPYIFIGPLYREDFQASCDISAQSRIYTDFNDIPAAQQCHGYGG